MNTHKSIQKYFIFYLSINKNGLIQTYYMLLFIITNT